MANRLAVPVESAARDSRIYSFYPNPSEGQLHGLEPADRRVFLPNDFYNL
jgi:hypothetical protein